jgi:hypothetical protein
MSESQREDEDRLLATISECTGGIVTGFVVAAEYIDEDGDRCIFGCTLTDQKAHTSLGLIAWADAIERAELVQWRRIDDEDED